MITWQKPLKVVNTDRYSLDLSSWLDGQSIAAASITPSGSFTTSTSTTIDGNIVSWLITGVSAGDEVFDVECSTVTRSDCIKVRLIIEDC